MYLIKRQLAVKAPVHSGGSLSHSFMEQVPHARHHQEVGVQPALIAEALSSPSSEKQGTHDGRGHRAVNEGKGHCLLLEPKGK